MTNREVLLTRYRRMPEEVRPKLNEKRQFEQPKRIERPSTGAPRGSEA